jgi:hypothetical protein
MEGLFTRDAQAACDFSFLASKFSPIFHGRLDAFSQRSLVEVLERSGTHTGHGGRSFEQTFQIMIVVLVQTPDRNQFLGAPQLAFHIAVIRAGTGFQGQSAVRP